MPESREAHGFTRVDHEARPEAWVEVLDTLRAHPFYRAYKRRVLELLAVDSTGLYLDVGAGTGADACATGARIVAVDRSITMCRESQRRGLSMSVKAVAEALPIATGVVDGCWSDRTFQHLEDPKRALAELVRVAKPDAPVVAVDPDYGTQVMEFPDQALAQQVFDFRAHHQLRNGTLAHRMAERFEDAGLVNVSAEPMTLVVRDPSSLDNVMGLRSWARSAASQGALTGDEADRWETEYDRVVEQGRFRWSVTFYITSGRKPAV